jgi:LacI family transcriptional regulator, galactose operon repressor
MGKDSARNVTIADVASEVGVSVQTVSRAINDKGEISEETKERVLEVVRRLNYQPNGIARGLVTRQTCTIGLVVPDITNPFFTEVARGVEDVAFSHSYNVFLCNTDEDISRETIVLNSLNEKRVDGLILSSSRLDDVALKAQLSHFRNVVLLNRDLQGIEGVGFVIVDDEYGAMEAVDFLIKASHRVIGLLAGPGRSQSGRRRTSGYLRALRNNGISVDLELVVPCEPSIDGGKIALDRLLTARSDVTAILAYNDLVSVGALQACRDLGRCVPRDLAIIGFDDIPLAERVLPPLTTMRIPLRMIGAEAVGILLSMMEGRHASESRIVLRPELVARGSV